MATQIRFQQISGSFPSANKSETASSGMSESQHGSLSDTLGFLASSIRRIHGSTDWSNVAAGVFSHTLKPSSDGGADLGTETAEWAALRANAVYSAAGLAISGSGNIDVDATGTGKLLLDGAGGIDIGTAANVAVDFNASTFQLDATGALSIDSADDSNVTVTGSAKDLDIAVAGGGTQELRLASAGTGPSAMHLNASAGGMNIDVADMLDIDVADEITIDTTSEDGHIAITSAHTAGDAILISANAAAGSILDVDAGIMDVDVQGTYSLDASGVSIDSDAASNLSTSAGDLTLDAAAGSLNLSGGEADAAAVRIHADASAGGIDIDAGTAGIAIDTTGALSMDAAAASNLSVAGANLTLSTTSSGNLVASAAGNVDVDGADVTIDATGGLSMDAASASNLSVAGANLTLSTTSSGNLVASAAGNVDVDGSDVTIDASAGLSLDAADDSNLTVTGSAKDLDIAVAGGGTQELRIASAGTGASALHLNASAGGMNVDVADMLDIDVADEITIDTTSADGHIAITSAHTAGDSILISANADAGSILDVDAGVMDVDVQAGFTLDASGISLDSDAASNFSTSAGDIDISAGGSLDMDAGAAVELNATTSVTVDGGSSSAMTLGASMGSLDLLRSGQMTTVKGTLNVDEAATFDGNVTIAGNLDVNGSVTTIDTTNMTIEDRIIGLGVSGSDGAYSALETGILFARGTAGVDAQSALFYNGSRYQLGKSATSPASSSFASVSSYEDLMLRKVEFDSANNHIAMNSSVFTMTGNAGVEVASGGSGDIVLDSAADVVLDGNGVKLEFGSADSGEHIVSDGTDLTVASGAKLNLTATSDVHIPKNVGLVFDDDASEKIESNDTDLTISSGAKINLTATSDVHIPANIGLVFGDGEKIEGDDTDLTVTSGAKINLTAGSDVVIPADVGLVFDGSGDDKIESDGTDLTVTVGGGDLVFALNGSSEGSLYPANDSQDTLGKDAESQEIASGFHSSLLSGITLNSSMAANIVRFSPGGSLPSGVSSIQSGDTITITDSNSTFTATASGPGSATAAVLSSFGSSLLSISYSGSSNSVLRVNSIGQFTGVAANDTLTISDGGSNVFTATVDSAAATDATLAQFLSFNSGQTITSSTTSIAVSSIPSGVSAQVRSGDTIRLVQGSVTATAQLSSDPSGSSYQFSGGFTLSGGSSVSTDSSFSTARFEGAGIPISSAFMSAGSSITPNGGSTTTITGRGIPLSGGTLSGEASSSDTFASGTATRSVSAKAWKNVFTDNIDLNGQGRIDLDADADTSIRASADDVITFEVGGADKLAMNASAFEPSSDDGMALGSASKNFSDLFLADGAVLNFGDDQDVTMTHDGSNGLDVSAAGGLDLDSTAGSMTVGASLADGQTLKLGKNGAVEMIFTPHGTAGSEKVSLTNTSGTAADAIALTSTAGGIDLSCADEKTVKIDQSLELVNISEPSSPSLQLYSVSSVLHWNGAPLGVPVVYRKVLSADDVNDSGSGSSQLYTFSGSDLTGDSDVTFDNSTVLNKVQVYLNGQLQYVASSGGDCSLSSTSNRVDFGSTGSLAADDILQVIVYA